METIICSVGSEVRGNLGAAIGVSVTNENGQSLAEEAQAIGNASSIFAEYNAVMVGLQTLQSVYGVETMIRQFEIKLTNNEVEKQLNDQLPITDPGLVPMFIEIHNLRVVYFPNLKFTLVAAADNGAVVQLVKEVLDYKV